MSSAAVGSVTPSAEPGVVRRRWRRGAHRAERSAVGEDPSAGDQIIVLHEFVLERLDRKYLLLPKADSLS